VGFLLAVVGTLLLLLSLASVALGSYMALDSRTREPGMFFAIWWIPAVAAAAGILMRDSVTFIIGVFCFAVAGAAFALEHHGSRRPARGKKISSRGIEKLRFTEGTRRWLSSKIREREYRRVAPEALERVFRNGRHRRK
jgi:hypothetical protein